MRRVGYSVKVGPVRAQLGRVVGVHLPLRRQVLAHASVGSAELVGDGDHRLVERDEIDLVYVGQRFVIVSVAA
jgi:hypothetical protein